MENSFVTQGEKKKLFPRFLLSYRKYSCNWTVSSNFIFGLSNVTMHSSSCDIRSMSTIIGGLKFDNADSHWDFSCGADWDGDIGGTFWCGRNKKKLSKWKFDEQSRGQTWKTFHKFSKTTIRSDLVRSIFGDRASMLHAMKSATDAARNADCSVFNRTSVKTGYHISSR